MRKILHVHLIPASQAQPAAADVVQNIDSHRNFLFYSSLTLNSTLPLITTALLYVLLSKLSRIPVAMQAWVASYHLTLRLIIA